MFSNMTNVPIWYVRGGGGQYVESNNAQHTEWRVGIQYHNWGPETQGGKEGANIGKQTQRKH